MTASATGIILRTRPLTETSIIVHWLTEEHGRLATVAKGARRPKSEFRGKLDLFYAADFSFSHSRRSELHTLREVSLRDAHAELRNDLGWLQQASYVAKLIEQTTETETPLPGIFELLQVFLTSLPSRPPQPRNIFAFELKLLGKLGLSPDIDQLRLTPGAKKLMTALTETSWPAIAELKATSPQAAELRQFLHDFLIYHLGKIPNGRML